MRVALVASALDALGGMEMVMLRTARYLAASGRRPVLVGRSFHADVRDLCASEGLEVRVLEDVGNPSQAASIERAGRALERLLADCAAVNPHNFPASVWVHAVRGSFHGRRLFYSCHEPPRHLHEATMDAHYVQSSACRRPWITRAFDALAWTRWRRRDYEATRGFETVLTNSTYTARKIREIYGREAIATWFGAPMPESGSLVGPGGAAGSAGGSLVGPGGAAGGAGRGEAEALRVLCVGRLTPMKNVAAGIEALGRLGPTAGVSLRVVGEGDQREGLERRASALGLGERVRFLGGVSEAELEAEYRAADAVLYVPYDEPMGLVPMEAALRDLPCVASDHGGPAEIFRDGESALLVNPGDAEAIGQALARLRDDLGLRRRLATAAHERVEALSFARYAAILDAVLDGRPVGP